MQSAEPDHSGDQATTPEGEEGQRMDQSSERSVRNKGCEVFLLSAGDPAALKQEVGVDMT